MDVDENVYVDEKALTDVATNKKKTKKVLSIIFITLFTVLIVAYFVMVYITSKRFNPGTIIDGRDMSFKTVDEASEIIKKDYDDFLFDLFSRVDLSTGVHCDADVIAELVGRDLKRDDRVEHVVVIGTLDVGLYVPLSDIRNLRKFGEGT